MTRDRVLDVLIGALMGAGVAASAAVLVAQAGGLCR